MIRRFDRLVDRDCHVLVIGGGIFGACVAWDAALRGLSVTLVEKGDFGGATSANHFHVVHGGIRYLQHMDLRRVRESAAERSALLRTAPHLVEPLPILMPAYGHGLRGLGLLRAGCGLYDLITVDRNAGIRDSRSRVPRSGFLGREETLAHFPALEREGLRGAAVFYDGQIYDAPRLVLSFVRAASQAGAVAVNYAEVTGFLRDGARVVGVRVRDRLGGQTADVRARCVVNAAGPWAAGLLEEKLDLRLGSRRPVFSRDLALVTRKRLSPTYGLAVPTDTRDAQALLDRGGRHLFVMPWRDGTLVGVWHGVSTDSPDAIDVDPGELRTYLAEANRAYRGLELGRDDVELVLTGLVLFGDESQPEGSHSFGHRSLVIDHADRDGIDGLVTLVGVRATMGRKEAARTVDLVCRKLGTGLPAPPTHNLTVRGGTFGSFRALKEEIDAALPDVPEPARRRLARAHGAAWREVLAHDEGEGTPDRLPGASTLMAEVLHGLREEMAVTLEDVVLRRTELGTAGRPGEAALRSCVDRVAAELGWDRDRVEAEVAALEGYFRERGTAVLHDDRSARRPQLQSLGGA